MNIVITGASSGVGYETALLLSSQGHTVFAIARNKINLEKLKEESLKVNAQSKLNIISGNIVEEDFVSTLVKEISAKVSSLDVLINNAGKLINKPFELLTQKEWREIYDVNVFAAVNLSKLFLPLLMKAKSKAHIVNISSMGAVQGSAKFAGLSAYTSSKSALAGVTECIAEEFKDKNVAVNCLCIGSVQTEMFSAAFPNTKAGTTSKEMAEFVAQFALTGQKLFNGKILPVANSTP
jgi:NAD(P)-dependent dehydrogenase (short-subunit alcohol dehydrogenase family)